MQLRALQRAPFGGLDELVDINDDDRLEAAARRSGEPLRVLSPAPGQLGHVCERVPSVETQWRHHLNRHAFIHEHKHAVNFYAAAATSCANDWASAMLTALTLG